MYLARDTSLAPILANFSRSVLSVQLWAHLKRDIQKGLSDYVPGSESPVILDSFWAISGRGQNMGGLSTEGHKAICATYWGANHRSTRG